MGTHGRHHPLPTPGIGGTLKGGHGDGNGGHTGEVALGTDGDESPGSGEDTGMGTQPRSGIGVGGVVTPAGSWGQSCDLGGVALGTVALRGVTVTRVCPQLQPAGPAGLRELREAAAHAAARHPGVLRGLRAGLGGLPRPPCRGSINIYIFFGSIGFFWFVLLFWVFFFSGVIFFFFLRSRFEGDFCSVGGLGFSPPPLTPSPRVGGGDGERGEPLKL